MSSRGLRQCLLPFALLAMHPCPGAAQSAERQGSFAVSAASGAAGAALGMGLAAVLAQPSATACPAVPGTNCSSSNWDIANFLVFSVAGAAEGAVLGRRLMGGRQSVLRSLAGAALGTLVGGFIASQSRTTQTVPLVVSIAVPQGFFAALVGR